jgi:DNA-binding PadR family transcriptional regulator
MAMQEPTFLILTALAAQPRHGYGVIQDVSALSGGTVSLAAGTLYAALDRLVGEGLVALDHEEVVEGRRRRYYRLTDSGAAVLAAEVARLRRHAGAAAGRLRRRGPATATFGLAGPVAFAGPAGFAGPVAFAGPAGFGGPVASGAPGGSLA